jgi:ribokinase
MWKAAVVGSLVVDLGVRTSRLPQRGDNIRAHRFQMGAGGKGGNAATAIRRLGGRAVAIGCIGDDDLGRFQFRALRAEGVDVSGITTIPGASTAVAVVLVEDDGQNAVLVADRTNELLTGAMVRAALEPHWEGLNAILVNFECARDAVATCIELGQQRRIPVIIDPAPAQPFDVAIWGRATVLTPNRSEAAALVGFALIDERTVQRAAHALRQAGPEVIVIKLGTEGAYLLTDKDEVVIPALDVDVVDTTGAGDAFTAALVASLLEGRSWRDGVRFANAAGALAATRFGTVSAMPTRAEIEALLSQMDR